MADDHNDQSYNTIGGDLMGRLILSNFEKYVRKLNKDQLRSVIKAAVGKYSDICMFKSIVDDMLVVCDGNNSKCDICPYKYNAECILKMVDHLMEVDDIC